MADEPLKIGDEVRIIEGVLAGRTGVIVSNSHEAPKDWIAVRLDLFGKPRVVEMFSSNVEKS